MGDFCGGGTYGCVVYEVWGLGGVIVVIVIVVIWVLGRSEFWRGDLEGERGEGFAEARLGRDSPRVGFDGEGCIET